MEENVYKTPDSGLNVSGLEGGDYAGFWIRLGASVIDTILVAIVILPILTLIYGTGDWDRESFEGGVWDILLNYLFPAIAVILFWVYKSAL